MARYIGHSTSSAISVDGLAYNQQNQDLSLAIRPEGRSAGSMSTTHTTTTPFPSLTVYMDMIAGNQRYVYIYNVTCTTVGQ